MTGFFADVKIDVSEYGKQKKYEKLERFEDKMIKDSTFCLGNPPALPYSGMFLNLVDAIPAPGCPSAF